MYTYPRRITRLAIVLSVSVATLLASVVINPQTASAATQTPSCMRFGQTKVCTFTEVRSETHRLGSYGTISSQDFVKMGYDGDKTDVLHVGINLNLRSLGARKAGQIFFVAGDTSFFYEQIKNGRVQRRMAKYIAGGSRGDRTLRGISYQMVATPHCRGRTMAQITLSNGKQKFRFIARGTFNVCPGPVPAA